MACLIIVTPLSSNHLLKIYLLQLKLFFSRLHKGYLIIAFKLNFPFRVKAVSLNAYFRSTKLLKFLNSSDKILKKHAKTNSNLTITNNKYFILLNKYL